LSDADVQGKVRAERPKLLEEVGGPDHWVYEATLNRHCSTCPLISSSVPASGVLHSGHTCPSSGFRRFIFPIRAAAQEKRDTM